jgi:hypothetical protein
MCVADILFLGRFCMWGCLLIPVWKGSLLGDSVLWVVLQSILTGFFLMLTAPLFCWQGTLVWMTLPVWVHLRNHSVSYGLWLRSPWPHSRHLPLICHRLVLVLWTVVQIPAWPTDPPFCCYQYHRDLAPVSVRRAHIVKLLICSFLCPPVISCLRLKYSLEHPVLRYL